MSDDRHSDERTEAVRPFETSPQENDPTGRSGRQSRSAGGPSMSRAGHLVRPIVPGGLTAVVLGLLFSLCSFLPFYTSDVGGGGTSGDPCASQKTKITYDACVARVGRRAKSAAGFHWDAWHRLPTWLPVLILLVVVSLFVLKAAGFRPRRRRLENVALLLVVLADLSFFWGYTHLPADAQTRAWGIYLALTLLLLVTIGVVLAFLNVDGLVSARTTQREKAARVQRQGPTTGPLAPGEYPTGQFPRYDTPGAGSEEAQPRPYPPGGYVPPQQ